MNHRLKIFLLCGVAALTLGGCAPQTTQVQGFQMDTYITLQAAADPAILQGGLSYLAELEQAFSRTDPQATVAILNAQRFLTAEETPTHLLDLMTEAATLSLATDGAFDPTMGRVSDLWDFQSDNPTLPDDATLQAAMSATEGEGFTLTETAVGEEVAIALADGIDLDLGGIAKGYATDLLCDYLKAEGVEDALLSLGGNIYAMGDKDGQSYQVGVADPDNPNELIGVLSVTDTAVVTSGDYQRYMEIDGKRYHHLLDPATGYPVQNDLRAVTVVSPSATAADGYATALFVMGYDKAVATVEADPTLEAVFIKTDGSVSVTDGLSDRFRLVE